MKVIKKYGLETPSFRLGRKIRPRVLVQGVSLKKTLDTKRQKCYIILTSWQTCQALSQGNVSAFPLDRG